MCITLCVLIYILCVLNMYFDHSEYTVVRRFICKVGLKSRLGLLWTYSGYVTIEINNEQVLIAHLMSMLMTRCWSKLVVYPKIPFQGTAIAAVATEIIG